MTDDDDAASAVPGSATARAGSPNGPCGTDTMSVRWEAGVGLVARLEGPQGDAAPPDDRERAVEAALERLNSVDRRDEEEERLIGVTEAVRASLGALERGVFERARKACNPCEGLGRAGFVCRSAVKLANLDHASGFALSRETAEGRLVFADACAAPGGFTEYMVSRSKRATGASTSLVGRNADGDGKRLEFDSPRVRVVAGDGTGDLYIERNATALVDAVFPANVALADGGFDAARDDADQDAALERLVVCEAEVALRALGDGGHFVLKLFLPLKSAGTRCVVDLASACFRCVKLVKPLASRPASGEVYLLALDCLAPIDLRRRAARVLRRFADFSASTQRSPGPSKRDSLAAARAAFLRAQADACRAILDLASGTAPPAPCLDLQALLLLWGLGGPPTNAAGDLSRSSKRKRRRASRKKNKRKSAHPDHHQREVQDGHNSDQPPHRPRLAASSSASPSPPPE